MVTKLQTVFPSNIFDASRKYKPNVFQKPPLHTCRPAYINATCVLESKNPSWCWSGPTVPPISEGQRPTSGQGKRTISPEWRSPIHAAVRLLYQTLESTLWYDTLTRRTWVTAASSNIVFKIAVKPLQKEWLLLTAYRKSTSPDRPIQRYHCRPPIAYRWATMPALRIDERHIAPKARPNCRTKTGAIKLCRFSRKLRNT